MSADLRMAGVMGKPYVMPATLLRPAGSVASTSVEEATSDASRILQQRVSSLEDDLVVIHRRVRDTSFSGSGNDSATSGRFTVLQQSVQQMLSELADERRQRDELEASIVEMESSLQQECNDRQAVLSSMAKGLEDTMQKLVRRIETGLGDGTSALQERAAKTEDLLRGLVARLEAGLEPGRKPLQDKAPAAGIPLSPMQSAAPDLTVDGAVASKAPAGVSAAACAVMEAVATASSAAKGVRDSAGKDSGITALRSPAGSPRAPISGINTSESGTAVEAGLAEPLPEPLLKVWDSLKQEHIMLKKKREQLVTAASEKRRSASRSSTFVGTAPSDHGKPERERDSDTMSLASSSMASGGPTPKDAPAPARSPATPAVTAGQGHQPPSAEKPNAPPPSSTVAGSVSTASRTVSPVARTSISSMVRPGLPTTPAGTPASLLPRTAALPKAAPNMPASPGPPMGRQVGSSISAGRVGSPLRPAGTSLQPGQARTALPVSTHTRSPQQDLGYRI